jgi:glycosyltransferase involved in cell wall biosynthesis
MIRVGIDTNALYVTQAGTARYIHGLIKGLNQIAAPDVEVFPIAWQVENLQYRQPQRALKTFYRELIWARFNAPRLVEKNHIQLLHAAAGPLIHPPRGIKEVATLLDLAILRHPERFRPWHRASARRRLQNLHRADRIICISRFTADEAMALLDLPAAKLAVIHCGSDFHPDEPPPPEAKPSFDVPAGFFLFVGSLEPGKNLALLKEVYALAEAEKRALPPLLIVGARWEGVGNEGAPPKDWHYLGHLPDAVLVYLYRRALALLFPSKYEGFGLPVTEAMALGCPVICSPVASLPEVGGDAAMFTDMTPADYLKAMQRLSHETGLRDELIGKGLVQAAKFSWKKCAGDVLDVYRSVLNAA